MKSISFVLGLAIGAYSEVIDVKALHKRLWRWLRVLVDVHAGGHTIVLGDGTRVELLYYLPSIEVSTPDLCR